MPCARSWLGLTHLWGAGATPPVAEPPGPSRRPSASSGNGLGGAWVGRGKEGRGGLALEGSHVLRILIDGIDLTGKTTTARALAKLLGGRYNSGPMHKGSLGRLADRVVAGRSPAIIKGVVSVFAYMRDRRAAKDNDAIVVQDRYWPSLLAFAQTAYPWPVPNISAALFARCPQFDADIFLTAPSGVLVERYKARDRKDRIEEGMFGDRSFAERYERALERIMRGRPNFRLFDTSHCEPQETAEKIAAWLRESNLLPSV
jgi:thymidylate kinase